MSDSDERPDGDKPVDPSTPKPHEVNPDEGTTEEGTPVENPSG